MDFSCNFDYVMLKYKFQQLNKLIYEIKMGLWFGYVPRRIIIAFKKGLCNIGPTEKYEWPAKLSLEVMCMKQIKENRITTIQIDSGPYYKW